MILSMLIPPNASVENLALAKQMGINGLITKASPELSGSKPPYDIAALIAVRDHFRDNGLEIVGLEGDQFDMAPIKLGLESRDAWIEKYKQMLRNMGELGIELLCLNWMASIGWFRTHSDTVLRGGALSTAFHFDDINNNPVEKDLRISEEKLFDNLRYFLDAVLPVAEESGIKMGLHPDDPPISPIRGVGRILSSVADYEKIFALYDSPNLGATFCQATFKVMGEDLKAVSQNWLKRKKIFFIHIRNAVGDKFNFKEIFIDEEGEFMSEMLEHYHRHGFDGAIRSDHAPAMGNNTQGKFEGSLSAGYGMAGHVFATGFIKGCCSAKGIPLF